MRHTAILFALALVMLWSAVGVRHWQQPVRLGDLESVKLDYRIPVNTADAATLELLPDVGPGIARHILDYRASGGQLNNPADLQRVRYIGPHTAAQMAPWVRFTASEPGRGDTDAR